MVVDDDGGGQKEGVSFNIKRVKLYLHILSCELFPTTKQHIKMVHILMHSINHS